jgi:cytochrome c
MDSFEWNKIAGAVLFALLLSVGLSIFSDVIFEAHEPETPGYVIAVATEEGAPAEEAQPFPTLLAAADPKAGQTSANKCLACHTFKSGEPNKVGPNLWGVVNRPIAAHEGYEYDDAMHAYAEQAKTWTFDNLNAFLHDPKGTVPGTKMAFPGLRDDKERANVVAYLNTLSDNPAPLPQAAAAEAPAETNVASAEGGAPAAEQPAAEAPAKNAETPAAEPSAPAEAPAPAENAQAPAEQPAAPEQQAAAPATASAAPAAGDAAKGQSFAGRCKACHTFEKGGPNRVGPHLFGVVGRPIASVADFSYSDAMKTFGEGGKVWDDATLDTYLADPKGTAPGNKMAFPGVKSEADRANLIAYLKTLAE